MVVFNGFWECKGVKYATGKRVSKATLQTGMRRQRHDGVRNYSLETHEESVRRRAGTKAAIDHGFDGNDGVLLCW